MQSKRHYLALDGLRGIAAVAVVFWHAATNSPLRLSSAYLAVDLFFLMSGFVIAYSYEEKILRGGMGFWNFVAVRIRRLFPMYILGTVLLFLLLLAGNLVLDKSGGHLSMLFGWLAAGIFMIPTNQGSNSPFLYPLSPAAWSLFFELAANFLYAGLLRYMSDRILALIAILSLAGLIYSGVYYGDLEVGWNWSTFAGGVPRVGFSFFLGILMYRHRDRLPDVRIPLPLVLLAVIPMLAIPAGGALSASLAVLAIAIGFPALIAAAVNTEPRRMAKFCVISGAISYPVYILHQMMMRYIDRAFKLAGVDLADHPWSIYPMVAVIIFASWAALKLIDEPVRKLLGGSRQRVVAKSLTANN